MRIAFGSSLAVALLPVALAGAAGAASPEPDQPIAHTIELTGAARPNAPLTGTVSLDAGVTHGVDRWFAFDVIFEIEAAPADGSVLSYINASVNDATFALVKFESDGRGTVTWSTANLTDGSWSADMSGPTAIIPHYNYPQRSSLHAGDNTVQIAIDNLESDYLQAVSLEPEARLVETGSPEALEIGARPIDGGIVAGHVLKLDTTVRSAVSNLRIEDVTVTIDTDDAVRVIGDDTLNLGAITTAGHPVQIEFEPLRSGTSIITITADAASQAPARIQLELTAVPAESPWTARGVIAVAAALIIIGAWLLIDPLRSRRDQPNALSTTRTRPRP